ESKAPSICSVYALSKYDQERLCLMVGGAYDIPTVALRFFNVYGPNQALSNPYSGVLAIFASRLLNDRPPLIFEDGEQRRDFVYVDDVADACRLALISDAAIGRALNIGSGSPVTVKDAARLLADTLGVPVEPEITGACRIGDVRHCFPDLSEARASRAGGERRRVGRGGPGGGEGEARTCGSRFCAQRPGHARSAGGAARARWRDTADVHLHQQGVRRDRRHRTGGIRTALPAAQ